MKPTPRVALQPLHPSAQSWIQEPACTGYRPPFMIRVLLHAPLNGNAGSSRFVSVSAWLVALGSPNSPNWVTHLWQF